MNAGELLRLTERTLVAPLDPYARSIVAASAKRVSVVTAVSPGALIDMLFVGAENLRMLRRLATLYGARPGTLSLFKLARMVVTHIVLTGGIALGDDVIQQLIGHGLTAKLSARLGEGIVQRRADHADRHRRDRCVPAASLYREPEAALPRAGRRGRGRALAASSSSPAGSRRRPPAAIGRH